jgi:outer membrane protein assembly factor BamB
MSAYAQRFRMPGFPAAGLRHLASALIAALLVQGCIGFHVKEAIRHSPIDWPMAGKTSAGTYADLSQQITLPLHVQWENDVSAGTAQNACIIVDGVLLCGTLRGEILGINAVTGKDIGGKKISVPISGAPASIGNQLYFCAEAGKETVCDYDLLGAEYIWRKNIGGISASPIVARIPHSSASHQDALVSGSVEQGLFIGTLDGVMYALRPSDGETLWKSKCAAPVVAAACALDSLVYCADIEGMVYAFSASSGAVHWKRKLGGAVYAGLSAAGGAVYIGSRDHDLYALDAWSGTVLWKYDCGERIMASASVSDSLVVVSALNGSVAALSHDGRLNWTFKAHSAVNTPCVIVRGIVFAASLDTYIYALSTTDGSVLWSHSIDDRIKTAPIVWNGSLFVIGDDRTIYRFIPE